MKTKLEFEKFFALIMSSIQKLVEDGIILKEKDVDLLWGKKELLWETINNLSLPYKIPFIPTLGSISTEKHLILYVGYPHALPVKSSDFSEFNGFLYNEGNFRIATENSTIGFMVGVDCVNFDDLYASISKDASLSATAFELRKGLDKKHIPLNHKDALSIAFQCREKLPCTSEFEHMMCVGSDWDGYEFAAIESMAYGRMEISNLNVKKAMGKNLVIPVCQKII